MEPTLPVDSPAVDRDAPTGPPSPDGFTRAPSELGSLAAELRGLAATPPPPRRVILERGALIDGIYRVEDELGEGGMGVVYRARDLRLDREVAIKIGNAVTPAAFARAEREAMALAKLSHPNVVVVYGVGELGGRLYLAMELVRGGSARAWRKAAARTPREIVSLYAAAGDGLAAAHAAGLVHRDFKPDNVLVGDDGRPRVGDFGLARDVETIDEATTEPRGEAVSDALTQAGAVLGTLGYMAPEQLAGLELDARADQFAFCASLWEALWGARPFAGRTLREVGDAIERGLPPTPDGVKVPAHVVRAVRRGLARDRLARWPSMAALCAELRRDASARRRRAITIAGVAAAGAVATAAIAVAWPRGAAPDVACDDGAEQITDAWSPARASAVRAQTGAAAPRALGVLDDHARRWREQYHAVCAAGLRGWSSTQIARGMECLGTRRDQLGAAAALLGDGPLDAGRVEALLDGLDAPERCADAAYLDADAPPPADASRAAAVALLERALVRAKQMELIGRRHDAATLTQAVLAGARGLAYEPLIADALHMRGIATRHDDPKAALADQRDAYFRAQESQARATAAASAVAAAMLMLELSRYEDAADWARIADDGAKGLSDPQLRVGTLIASASVASSTGADARAVALADQAVGFAEGTHDVELIRKALYIRGDILVQAGRPGDGAADLRRGIDLVTKELGPDSPDLVELDVQLGTALTAMGQGDQAVPVLRSALALAERDYGPDAAEVGDVSDQLGNALDGAGQDEESLAAIDRGLAITERTQGPHAYNTGVSYANRAAILNELHRAAESEADSRRAIAIFTDALGPDDPMVGQEWTNLGLTQNRAGEDDDAIASLEKGKAIFEKAAPNHPTLAFALTALGNLRVARGELATGRAELERALALRQSADTNPAARASTEIELARVVWRQGDHPHAVTLARAAEADFLRSGSYASDAIAPYFDEILGKGKWQRQH
jgi:tetratricopeptide (TPR) repeat protein